MTDDEAEIRLLGLWAVMERWAIQWTDGEIPMEELRRRNGTVMAEATALEVRLLGPKPVALTQAEDDLRKHILKSRDWGPHLRMTTMQPYVDRCVERSAAYVRPLRPG